MSSPLCRGRGLLAGGVAGILVAVWAGSAGAAVTVTRSTLTFSEQFASGARAVGVNAAGTVFGNGTVTTGVGLTGITSKSKALLWTGTAPTDITPIGATQATVTGLSDNGISTGTETDAGVVHGFIRQGTGNTTLPVGQTILGVSSNGYVLLAYTGTDGRYDFGVWTGGGITQIESGVPTAPSGKVWFNATGTVALVDAGTLYAYTGGQRFAVPLPAGATNPVITGFDDTSRILGQVTVGGVTEGVVWSGTVADGAWAGTTTVLTGLPGQSSTTPAAMNASGAVVGTSGGQAVRWAATGGAAVALPEAKGDVVSTATGISSAGTIIGAAATTSAGLAKGATIWVGGTTPTAAFSGALTTGALTAISAGGKVVGWGNTGLPGDSDHGYAWVVSGG